MDPSMQASFPSNPNLQGSMGSPYMGVYPPDGYTSHGFNSDYSTKMANIKAMGNGMLPVSWRVGAELVRDWLDGVGVSGESDKVVLTRSGAAGERGGACKSSPAGGESPVCVPALCLCFCLYGQ